MFTGLTLYKAIELAITIEQLGAEYYARMEKKFKDESELKEIFNQLAKDEILHEAQFKALIENVPDDEPEKQQYELYQFLRATAISEFFSKDYFKHTDNIKSSDVALGRALAFEKATLQFYEAIKEILGESKELDDIIATERSHVVALMRIIVADAKFRGMDDKW
jgi:rubrerythrin